MVKATKESGERKSLPQPRAWEVPPLDKPIVKESSLGRKAWIQPLRQSSCATCLGCARKYMFTQRWCIFLRRPTLKKALSLGRMVHRLMELGRPGINIVRKEVDIEAAEFTSIVERDEDLMGEAALAATTIYNNYQQALAMVTLLWQKHPRPDTYETIERERRILINVDIIDGKPPVFISVKLDEILQVKETGDLFIRDFKTTSSNIAYTLTGYSYSLQCRMYRLGVAVHQNKSPVGFILDILRKPTIVMCDKDRDYTEYVHTFKRGYRRGQTETRKKFIDRPPIFENYLDRCRQWYKDSGDEGVQSFSVRFVEPVLPLELASALRRVSYYQVAAAIPGFFPRDITTQHCKSFNRVCDYYPLCQTGESAWDAIIEEQYEVRTPDVEGEYKTKTTGEEGTPNEPEKSQTATQPKDTNSPRPADGDTDTPTDKTSTPGPTGQPDVPQGSKGDTIPT